jgi:hypothetical protein
MAKGRTAEVRLPQLPDQFDHWLVQGNGTEE